MTNMREISKENFTNEDTSSAIKLGALQRIADATELMAKDHARLIADRDMYRRWYEEERDRKEVLARQNIALRGVITRMKKKTAQQANTEQS